MVLLVITKGEGKNHRGCQSENSSLTSTKRSSIPRASSNLELLSQTAAWKNDLENPARVSPSSEIALRNSTNNKAKANSVYTTTTTTSSTAISSPHAQRPTAVQVSPPTGRSTFEDHSTSPKTATTVNKKTTSWTEHWKSLMFPITNESSSGSFEDKEMEISAASSAFRHPQTVHAAFCPPMPTRKRPVGLTSCDSTDSSTSNKRLNVTSVTTTTTTIIAPREAASSATAVLPTAPPFVIEPALRSAGSWTWTQASQASSCSNTANTVDELARDNALLRHELSERNKQVDLLQQQIEDLQTQVEELRQLPTGKISQIPVADMLELMQTFGSEISDHTHVPSSNLNDNRRKVQKASIVRQFRRWNPNFHEFFHFKEGKWTPKLGVRGEQERRAQNRARRRLEKVSNEVGKKTGRKAGIINKTSTPKTKNNNIEEE